MLYGVSYYHEYQPYERLAEDIRLMREAGLTLVRLGESTWSSWEPQDGCFEFAWMDRVIDALHEAGIKIILGTPTYAIPSWLHRRYPDIMAQYSQGRRGYYGGRQNMNHAHAAYRFYAERMIRQLVSHYAQHKAIIGYQVDNETGSGLLYNPDVFQKFVDYLKDKFRSLEELNKVWGLTYWSHRLGDWADLWMPDGNTNPGYDLEWRRFQSSLVTDLLGWEAQLVRQYARPDQFVTQDVVAVHGRAESDVYEIAKHMDSVAINPYHMTQEGLNLGGDKNPAFGAPDWMETVSSAPGVWKIYLNGDFARGVKQSNYLVTEINATSIGGSYSNYPAYDGQLRQVVYAHISRGAKLIAYWHWHTLHYGNESYWGGVLNHDLEPGRTFAEVQRIAHELRQHDAILTDLTPDANVAFLYSQDSKYALEFMPALTQPSSNLPDRTSYQRIFDTFYRGFFDARAQTIILHPEQKFEAYPLLVVPALYTADSQLLERLTRYAASGGHLLLTFRSGYADEFARIHWHRAPGVLRQAVGASYQEYSNLVAPLPLKAGDDCFPLPEDAHALGWADGLQLEGSTPLVYYQHVHFGRFPAVVSHLFGKGRVTYCGTLPNHSLSQALAQWCVEQAGIQLNFTNAPVPVRVTSATAHDGRRLWFFTNWSYEAQQVDLVHLHGYELFSNKVFVQGSRLILNAWDSKIIVAQQGEVWQTL